VALITVHTNTGKRLTLVFMQLKLYFNVHALTFSTCEELSLPMKHVKNIVLIFLTMKGTILYTHGSGKILTVTLKVSGHTDVIASVETVGAIVVNVSKSSLR
jgi:hypothetical protein